MEGFELFLISELNKTQVKGNYLTEENLANLRVHNYVPILAEKVDFKKV